ncbi:hypothetical protein VFPFJ_11343 [Purpureocillium lilacinum]|uniref:Uncharacterized protein n=1 Tax=Purpureocillium lilacinum TaxID=33203 RepID=A0A179FFP4_PURLI|nr:hypothetical protein VFPFJ_11343 [Purpureocillium lilacinum]OAQ63813.1 hypothetical protein VFPFJ_11343 [Purpureocillium lilacinum]
MQILVLSKYPLPCTDSAIQARSYPAPGPGKSGSVSSNQLINATQLNIMMILSWLISKNKLR